MTNLEFNKDKILKEFNKGYSLGCSICNVMNKTDEKSGCYGIKCEKAKMLYWMLGEHEEPIKLKQYEYDLIKAFDADDYTFEYFDPLKEFKKIGYFSGIKDISMKIKDILDNCIIVADDYEGFDDCK